MTAAAIRQLDSAILADPEDGPSDCYGDPFCDCEACLTDQAIAEAQFSQYIGRVPQ